MRGFIMLSTALASVVALAVQQMSEAVETGPEQGHLLASYAQLDPVEVRAWTDLMRWIGSEHLAHGAPSMLPGGAFQPGVLTPEAWDKFIRSMGIAPEHRAALTEAYLAYLAAYKRIVEQDLMPLTARVGPLAPGVADGELAEVLQAQELVPSGFAINRKFRQSREQHLVKALDAYAESREQQWMIDRVRFALEAGDQADYRDYFVCLSRFNADAFVQRSLESLKGDHRAVAEERLAEYRRRA